MGPSYFQILSALLLFAATHKDDFLRLWGLIVASYKAGVDLYNGARDAIPGLEIPAEASPTAGTLSYTQMTPDELDAEERLEQILAPDSSLAFKLGGGGSLRKIITWLQTSPVGAALLAELLKRLGS